jgi:hypothetical protein
MYIFTFYSAPDNSMCGVFGGLILTLAVSADAFDGVFSFLLTQFLL